MTIRKSRIKLAIACAAAMLSLSPGFVAAGTFDAWACRSKIRFAGYDRPETLTNFPALVVLSTNITGFLYSDFNSASNGADLRFTSSNELTALNYEIEKWDTNGSSYVWVQVPYISSASAAMPLIRPWALRQSQRSQSSTLSRERRHSGCVVVTSMYRLMGGRL